MAYAEMVARYRSAGYWCLVDADGTLYDVYETEDAARADLREGLKIDPIDTVRILPPTGSSSPPSGPDPF